jgi:hypothetical protein
MAFAVTVVAERNPGQLLQVEDVTIIPGGEEDLPQLEEHRLPTDGLMHVGDDNDALADLSGSRLEV